MEEVARPLRVPLAGEPDDLDEADVPEAVPAARRATLVARPDGEDRWRFDIRIQGEGETVSFAV